MPDARLAALAILAMAATTYLTRLGGYWLVGLTQMTPGLERFLKHLSGSILAALLAPTIMGGDPAAAAGVAVAAVFMLLARRPLLALVLGVAATSLLRLKGLTL